MLTLVGRDFLTAKYLKLKKASKTNYNSKNLKHLNKNEIKKLLQKEQLLEV